MIVNLHAAINVSLGRLYNGRRSFYASLWLADRRWFVSRWDTARVPLPLKPGQRLIARNESMTWYAGASRT